MLAIRNQDRHIGIVMAKGQSERVHKKNLQAVGGKPLFVHALETLRHSGVCGTVIVSTTTDELADLALEHGADDIVMRDPNLIDWYPAKAFSLREYERTSGVAYDYCSVLGGNAAFVLPSWFRTATHILQNYTKDSRRIARILTFPAVFSCGVARIDRTVLDDMSVFSLSLKGIVCDIDDLYDLRLAQTIGALVADGTIPYPMDESVHDEALRKGQIARFNELQPIGDDL